MYANRKDARTVRINLSITPETERFIAAIAELNGMQKTAWVRDYFLEKVQQEFGGNSGFSPLDLRATGT
ncbi:hypothetical protein NF681_11305 [Comamonadaceae bacterium OTU4NAUVB1]|jgi:uncharacterized protein (DUF1778 family)|nr:hypothetical protein NF681_11305 [Comamonadaceae bacterium OTU4NAUVB1]